MPPGVQADPLVGTVVADRYRLVQRIAASPLCQVYRARHELLDKAVAVKLLDRKIADKRDAEARFRREALAAARLDHPNCVAVSDFGRTSDGHFYLVMEYLEGHFLERPLPGSATPWPTVVALARQVLRGLARAHEMGVVHRDIRPQNIMLMPLQGGRVLAKVTDFGIGRVLEDTLASSTGSWEGSALLGNLEMLAPERIRDAKGKADPRWDVYSLGIVMYELLTGERPFEAGTPEETVRRIESHSPAVPSRARMDAEIPLALDAAVMKALEKNPEERFASARAFLAALEELPGTDDAADAGLLRFAEGTPALGQTGASRFVSETTSKIGAWIAVLVLPLAMVTLGVGYLLGWYELKPSTRRDAPSVTQTGAVPPAAAGSPTSDGISDLVHQAARGATVEERHAAFRSLERLGLQHRVARVEMLTADLAQLPTCEERRSVVVELGSLKNPAALSALQVAHGRGDNGCLRADAARAIAALGGHL